jgi:uncharacterized protein (DUF2252 family)
MQSIRRSTKLYEDWLAAQLRGDLVRADLRDKHRKMQKDAFAFLRATYWRWAETVLEICPELKTAPKVLAVGDLHLENFGTWRDVEGRLIWGVNDFDEAALMPYALDLVRLATSTLLAHGKQGAPADAISRAILSGYRRGLEDPCAIVLDRKYRWLRKLLVATAERRRDFWRKIEAEKPAKAPPRYRKALQASMPKPGLVLRTARRTAGAGSLGRPRWVALADWNGGKVVREAKALLPSAWHRAHPGADPRIRCGDIAAGRHRAPDPWYAVADSIVVRRLSPNNRKIEADDPALQTVSERVLEAIGRELAAVHLGVSDRRQAIKRHLDKRDAAAWLADCAERMAKATRSDFKAYRGATR